MSKKLWVVVNIFFGLMVEKLIHQKTCHGYAGWDYTTRDILLKKLSYNVSSSDWVDVANLAMMLDYHDRKILEGRQC